MFGKTYMARPQDIERKWYIIDAAGNSLGRVAQEAAKLLRGKHKTIFTPHVDTGDHVIIINAEKAVLTGNKLRQKKLIWHSGYPGGLKSIDYKTLMQRKPEKAMEVAVRGMVPHNSLGRAMFRKLKVYRGCDHPHQAQKPESWRFEA